MRHKPSKEPEEIYFNDRRLNFILGIYGTGLTSIEEVLSDIHKLFPYGFKFKESE